MKELLAFAALGCGVAVATAYALSPKSVESLLQDLQSSDPSVRRSAVVALGKCRDDSEHAIPALRQALEDDQFAIRVLAGVSLSKLGEPDGEVPFRISDLPMLIDALSDRSYHVSDSARDALKELGSLAVPALVKQLDHSDSSVRSSVLSVLSALGPAAADAAPALSKFVLQEQNKGNRWTAISTLGHIGPPAADAVPVLIELLEHGGETDRRHAANALGGIGGAEALATLERLVDDPDAVVARNARLGLSKLRGPEPRTKKRRKLP